MSYFRQYAYFYPRDHAKFRFGHTDDVATGHYVAFGAQTEDRGKTIESWYGCAEEVNEIVAKVIEEALSRRIGKRKRF